MKSLLQSKDENLPTTGKLPVEVGVDSQSSDTCDGLAEAKRSVVMHDDDSSIVMNDDRSIVDPVVQTVEKLSDLTLIEDCVESPAEAPDGIEAHKEGDMKTETGVAEERGKEEPSLDPIEEEAKKRLHSRKFREYCDHDLSKDLGKSFTTLVTLVIFHKHG
jgi:hypothetical protein